MGMYIMTAVATALLGAVAIVFFAMRNKVKNSELEHAAKEAELTSDLRHAKEDLEKAEKRAAEELEKQKKGLEEQHRKSYDEMERRHNEALESQKKIFDETVENLRSQIKNATLEMLREREEQFKSSSQESIKDIVAPVNKMVEDLKKSIDESDKDRTAIAAAMKENLQSLEKQTENAKKSAEELANAMKHKSKIQGDWGEKVLSELLESQGLRRGIDFEEQTNFKGENGENLRPDLLLHIDNRRDVIIDSKVSMTAFIDYVNAEDDELRDKFMKSHIQSLKSHVEELSKKEYTRWVKEPHTTMDYVMMFVPHSAALLCALNEEPTLWRWAMDKNVYIVDEQTLYAALRIIKLNWTLIRQAENHKEIFKIADEMVKRVAIFCENYEKIGTTLAKVQENYENGKIQLGNTGRSICTSARQLVDLGAKGDSRIKTKDYIDVDEPLALETDADSEKN